MHLPKDPQRFLQKLKTKSHFGDRIASSAFSSAWLTRQLIFVAVTLAAIDAAIALGKYAPRIPLNIIDKTNCEITGNGAVRAKYKFDKKIAPYVVTTEVDVSSNPAVKYGSDIAIVSGMVHYITSNQSQPAVALGEEFRDIRKSDEGVRAGALVTLRNCKERLLGSRL